MKRIIITLGVLCSGVMMAQVGHLMQGIGSVNMSMGGAATGQPIDISGALQWNPAGITDFNGNTFSVNAGLFMSNPEISSSYGPMSGVTKDEKANSIMPAVAVTFGKNPHHKFGISVFGVSGFGVEYPESTSNPILMSQQYGGFGKVESNYMLMQVGFAYAYKFNENFSMAIQPNVNYSALKIHPNPLANPSMTAGYPNSDNASAIGFGAQVGMYFKTNNGFKLGLSYKSPVYFNEFKFENTYLDNTKGENKFTMNFPAIYSVGGGYSHRLFDLALDYRYVDYANTEGFLANGWSNYGAVKGFGWESIDVISAGIQIKAIEKMPIRLGYTYSSNPINPELTMFSVPASAIIRDAYEIGVGYKLNDKFTINANYHYGASDGKTSGALLNPMMASPSNPYGAIPGSTVAYEMTTSMAQLGVDFKF